MKRIVIACGGTGGHLTPGIALAQELEQRGYKITLFVSSKSVDSRLCKHYPTLKFIQIPGCAFGWRPFGLCKFIFKTLRAFVFSWKYLKKYRDATIVSFGGFSAAGICLAAFVRRRPIFLHEANLHIGRAIHFLAPLAKKVYIPPKLKETTIYRSRAKYIPMGYPIRRDFLPLPRAFARRLLELPKYGRCLVIFGGSQGASALVEWVREYEIKLINLKCHVICLTGLNGIQMEIQQSAADGQVYHIRYKVFSDHMNALCSAADLVVCRAGAGSIAELIRCHTPSILVPYPSAVGDHQTLNAKAHAKDGMAILLPQNKLSELFSIVEALDGKTLQAMRKILAKFDRSIGNPAATLADDIIRLK
ncbi:MAG: UDP-N-acetylglucosamine--N-acetylmuramyl-(pentapeptide) pyrophosphoryl-undecaprenol N-acetylglucosamine transferase [Puniceicoccales bacterium]|jgi:UDP-N-acetylglucosamine--N-acetylmuramyl-(pentapeptide) pyrophosphoryl-undecaprenol N-acetylglucosamine transferase|nr:UDP-N-acetylglucosamine--N-acetylmuramyl-(pentapeptide) pyrophosphoryl-undecaprenol N-acetylglucosamine transferase [Puniceicoccales bacterium]